VKHHNFFKTKVCADKIYKNYLQILCILPKNLNLIHQELCEVVFVKCATGLCSGASEQLFVRVAGKALIWVQ